MSSDWCSTKNCLLHESRMISVCDHGDGFSDALISGHTKGVLQRETMRVYVCYGPVE